jgi:hypothetical protein
MARAYPPRPLCEARKIMSAATRTGEQEGVLVTAPSRWRAYDAAFAVEVGSTMTA